MTQKKVDQSQLRQSDVSLDAPTQANRVDKTPDGGPQTQTSSSKERESKTDLGGSRVKMSFGGGGGSVLGKRPAGGAITMKLKPQPQV